MHSELRHILLSENCCKLASTVVTEVEEDDSIALLDGCKRLVVLICDDDKNLEPADNVKVYPSKLEIPVKSDSACILIKL
jgi:hypothetical protein